MLHRQLYSYPIFKSTSISGAGFSYILETIYAINIIPADWNLIGDML